MPDPDTLPDRHPMTYMVLGMVGGVLLELLVATALGAPPQVKWMAPLGAAFGVAAYLADWRTLLRHPEVRDDEPVETDADGPMPAYGPDDLDDGWPPDDGEGG